MAITPADLDALPEFTDAQLLKQVRHTIALLDSTPDATVTFPNGRTWEHKDLAKLQSWEARLTRRVADAAIDDEADAAGGGAIAVQFEEVCL